jgi:hypothetical protein
MRMGLSRHSIAALSAAAFGISTQATMAQTTEKCEPYYFALRSDFNDLGPFSCPLSNSHAQGASASETYNTLTKQNSASFDGLAAVVHQFFGDFASSNRGLTAGLFVQGDVTYQFQPTPKQTRTSDTVTSGAFTQFAIGNSILRNGAEDYFRIRGGETDASSGSRSATFVGEWIPVYQPGIGLQKSFGNLTYVFSPELMVQYDEFLGGPNKAALFFAQDRALRVGPELVLQSWLTPPDGTAPFLKGLLSATSSSITFHEAWDAYTGRNYMWVAASLTYTFEALNSHFGISAGYGYGNSEATGTLTNQVKLGLSAKF